MGVADQTATRLTNCGTPGCETESVTQILKPAWAHQDVQWHRVTLELTEHLPIDDYATVKAILDPLRAAGALLSVDDTGAGIASLRHILELKPDVVKLDIGIVRGLVEDPSRQALVRMLVEFSEAIGARLVAEGVETEQQRDVLLGLGVVFAQG